MTRRGTGLVLLAVAALLAAGAVFTVGRLAGDDTALPANEHREITFTAAGASYYSPVLLKEVTAVVGVTDKIEATDPGAGSGSLAAWNVTETVTDLTRHQELEPQSQTIVFDRRTAQLVDCCNSNVNGNGLVTETGIAGYAFPVGTARQGYDVFDPVLGEPEPAVFSGTAVVGGVPVYLFTENIGSAPAGSSPLAPGRQVRYLLHRVYQVDPDTGLVLTMSEDENRYVAPAHPGQPSTPLFDASLRMTPASTAGLVRQDQAVRSRLAQLSDLRLAGLGAAGTLTVAAGWLLISAARRRRGGQHRKAPAPLVTGGPPGPDGGRPRYAGWFTPGKR